MELSEDATRGWSSVRLMTDNPLTKIVQIDYDKLLIAGGFNTMKTAQNTWGKIKKKLAAFSDGGDAPSMPSKYRRVPMSARPVTDEWSCRAANHPED